MNFNDVYEKTQKSLLPGCLKEVSTKKHENYSGRFPEGGAKRGKPTMTTSTVTARRKRDPQHHVEGKKV